MGLWGGGHGESNWIGDVAFNALPGAIPLALFTSQTGLDMPEWLALVTATFVLIFQAGMAWFIGQALFKGKEVE